MLITEKDVETRLNSPLNLINKMRNNESRSANKNKAMSLFGIGKDRRSEERRNEQQTVNTDRRSEERRKDLVTTATIPHTFLPQPQLAQDQDSSEESITPEVLPAENPENQIDDLMDDANAKIKLSLAHDEALDTLVKSVQALKNKIDEVPVKQLPSLAANMSKVVNEIRAERNKTAGTKSVHLHFYSPEQKKIEDYESVEV